MTPNLRSVAVALLVACGGAAPDAARPDDAPSDAGPTHAVAGVAAGSHDDWCGEHAVPESLCTRCDAALIPAFQATGDWCGEHGLPESQCLQCDPDLQIERPPKEG